MSENTVELTVEECWDLLRSNEFGRLAFHLADEVHITPINFAVDGDTLLFSSEPRRGASCWGW